MNKWMVLEIYRDGGTWKHFYKTEQEADWGIEEMSDAHSGRTYEKVELPSQ